jgi:HSP20 family protein
MFGDSTGFDSDFLDQFERMRREIDAMFGDRSDQLRTRPVAAGTYPGINVGASPKQVDVYVFAAGADPKSLDISLQQNQLTVSGERNIELHDGAQAYRRERFTGSFKRVITLPDDVDPEKVKATCWDGLLHITVQREEELQPRKIEVK